MLGWVVSRAIDALREARRKRFARCTRHPEAQHFEAEGPEGLKGLVCSECWELDQSRNTVAATEWEDDPS